MLVTPILTVIFEAEGICLDEAVGLLLAIRDFENFFRYMYIYTINAESVTNISQQINSTY